MTFLRLFHSISIQVAPALIVLSALITNINSKFYISSQSTKVNIAYLLAISLVVLLITLFFKNKPKEFFLSLVEAFYDLGIRFLIFGGIGILTVIVYTILENPKHNSSLEEAGKFAFGKDGMVLVEKYYALLYPVFAVGTILLAIGLILKLLKFFNVISNQKKVTANKTVVKQILSQRQRVNKYYQAKDFQSKYDSNVANFSLPNNDGNMYQIDHLKANELEQKLNSMKQKE
jgi:hypothetical protein